MNNCMPSWCIALDRTRVGQEVDGVSTCHGLAAFPTRSPDQEPSVPEIDSVIDVSRDWFTQYHLGQSVHGCRLRAQGRKRLHDAYTETRRRGLTYMHFLPRCWHSKALVVDVYTTEAPDHIACCATYIMRLDNISFSLPAGLNRGWLFSDDWVSLRWQADTRTCAILINSFSHGSFLRGWLRRPCSSWSGTVSGSSTGYITLYPILSGSCFLCETLLSACLYSTKWILMFLLFISNWCSIIAKRRSTSHEATPAVTGSGVPAYRLGQSGIQCDAYLRTSPSMNMQYHSLSS